ncbi:MAG: hypothetical protein ACOX6N_03840 [Patescibacteria group bacterium]|jgi:SOS response regulatory protein OraA/RecX
MTVSIKSIKPSRFPNRVNIHFDSGLILPFPFDQALKLSLQKNLSLHDKEYRDIVAKSVYYLALEFALRQVAMSPKTDKVIAPKIKNKIKGVIIKYRIDSSFFDSDSITASVIAILKKKDLLKPEDYLRFILQKNRHKSNRHLQFLLSKQGIDSKLLGQVESDDKSKIKHLLDKKNVTKQDLSDFKTKNKIIASLFRKGFSLNDVKTVIDEMANNK